MEEMYSARVVEHSINPAGVELITLKLRYPRFIHAEFLTHRVFSRNSSSSRAIPVKKLIDKVKSIPVEPVYWGKNKKGMQAEEELSPSEIDKAKWIWDDARKQMILAAELMADLGAHKQIVNRLLEPFSIIETLVTATDWDNFFSLRLHKDAQPEIQTLAKHMKYAIASSTPRFLEEGEWHLPFVSDSEKEKDLETAKKCSVARCARVSYFLPEGGSPTIERDLDLFNRLITAKPMHASPAEHQAMSIDSKSYIANFRGWKQYRKFLEEEEKI